MSKCKQPQAHLTAKNRHLSKFWAIVTQGKVSVVPGGQEVGPDVEGLIGELEEAPDAICGGAAGVPVP